MAAPSFWQGFANTLKIRTDKPELVRAQVNALTRQIPVLYMLLLANAVALAYTHYGTAPDWMTIHSVIVLGVISSSLFCLPHGQSTCSVLATPFNAVMSPISYQSRLLAVFSVW